MLVIWLRGSGSSSGGGSGGSSGDEGGNVGNAGICANVVLREKRGRVA